MPTVPSGVPGSQQRLRRHLASLRPESLCDEELGENPTRSVTADGADTCLPSLLLLLPVINMSPVYLPSKQNKHSCPFIPPASCTPEPFPGA